MQYREAITRDIEGVLALQEKNLVTNLDEEQKKQGFVTTPFVVAQLEALIARSGLFVADDAGSVRGYAAAAGWDYFAGRPMFDLMIQRFASITYKGIKIDNENSFQYGPVCIDASLRGSDSFPRLFSTMKGNMAKRFVVGTTFINKKNTRSFEAHTRKVGIEVIDEFDFNGNSYYGLAFLTGC